MRTIVWGNIFIRSLKKTVKKNPQLKPNIDKTLQLLQDDPFSPKLETHKLRGKLEGSWACSVDYEYRIVFDFMKNPSQNEDDILLIDIGTHDEVY